MSRFRASHLRQLTQLGRVAGLRYSDGAQDFETSFEGDAGPGVVFFWSPAARALVWWVDADEPPDLEAAVEADDVGEHAETWRLWTRGQEVNSGVEAHTPATEGPLRDIGPAVWIDYDSDKFGRAGFYRHRFGRGVVVACTPGNVAMWVVIGGDLEITRDGIEG